MIHPSHIRPVAAVEYRRREEEEREKERRRQQRNRGIWEGTLAIGCALLLVADYFGWLVLPEESRDFCRVTVILSAVASGYHLYEGNKFPKETGSPAA